MCEEKAESRRCGWWLCFFAHLCLQSNLNFSFFKADLVVKAKIKSQHFFLFFPKSFPGLKGFHSNSLAGIYIAPNPSNSHLKLLYVVR